MKVQDQQSRLFESVYGTPPNVLYNYDLFIKGLGDYQNLYEEVHLKRKMTRVRLWMLTVSRSGQSFYMIILFHIILVFI